MTRGISSQDEKAFDKTNLIQELINDTKEIVFNPILIVYIIMEIKPV
jgi:hypothetical protein